MYDPLQQVTPMQGRDRYPDRMRLPLRFDPFRLAADLALFDRHWWTPHFLPRNYTGEWSAMPLRAPHGAEHPILMLTAHPGAAFVDAPALQHTPYIRSVLAALPCPLNSVRLMRLAPGSSILEHTDPGLCAEEGSVRLHIPILTNPDVRFFLNDIAVPMAPGDLWYLRLSDPHRVDNLGKVSRVHLVVDADVSPWLLAALSKEASDRSSMAGMRP